MVDEVLPVIYAITGHPSEPYTNMSGGGSERDRPAQHRVILSESVWTEKLEGRMFVTITWELLVIKFLPPFFPCTLCRPWWGHSDLVNATGWLIAQGDDPARRHTCRCVVAGKTNSWKVWEKQSSLSDTPREGGGDEKRAWRSSPALSPGWEGAKQAARHTRVGVSRWTFFGERREKTESER